MAAPRAKKKTTRTIRTEPIAAAPDVTAIEIARRAYDLYLSRGCQHGHDLDDWLQAERELGQTPASLSA